MMTLKLKDCVGEIHVRHFCFWEAGSYLEFMRRFSDEVKVDRQLWMEVASSEMAIFGTSWKHAFNNTWLGQMGGVGRTGIGPGSKYAYDDRHLDSLVKLVRNASHHLRISTPRLCEGILYYLRGRSQEIFLPALSDAVVKRKHPTLRHYLWSAY
ncbi:retrovirus-related pol polyprotein from transposon TNT 1-94 [Tanacetum coccineum]